MVGRVEGKHGDVIGIHAVSDKAACGVGVKGDHEEKCQVMGVPECLEALATDLVVSGCVHYDHDE